MRKLLLSWKTIREKSVRGTEFKSELPAIVQIATRGKLLDQILSMKPARPISFENAMRLLGEEKSRAFACNDFAGMSWLSQNFVSWIAEQGFHIEITGDEFEAAVISDKVS